MRSISKDDHVGVSRCEPEARMTLMWICVVLLQRRAQTVTLWPPLTSFHVATLPLNLGLVACVVIYMRLGEDIFEITGVMAIKRRNVSWLLSHSCQGAAAPLVRATGACVSCGAHIIQTFSSPGRG